MSENKDLKWVCAQIASDMANDAAKFEGAPFNGRTLGEYLGNHGAAIAALANIVLKQQDQIVALEARAGAAEKRLHDLIQNLPVIANVE